MRRRDDEHPSGGLLVEEMTTVAETILSADEVPVTQRYESPEETEARLMRRNRERLLARFRAVRGVK